LPGFRTSTTGKTTFGCAERKGVSEWTLAGTTPAGDHVEVRGCDHFEFRNGKIVKKDSYWKIVEPR